MSFIIPVDIQNVVDNFFIENPISEQNVSTDYKLYKMGQLYENIDNLYDITSGFSENTIENPVDIASDFVCGWYDPSNTLLMSLTAGTNTLVNNASGYCLYDKSNFNNNLNIVAGGSGLEYDPVKRMIHHSGGSVASILQNTTLSAKQANHFTTPSSSFSYFIVAESEIDWTGGTLRVLCQAGGTENIGFIPDVDRNTIKFNNNNFGTDVVHPTTPNYFYGKRFIYGFVCGTDTIGFYRDMYYNGIWVGRQRTGAGSSRNGSLHIGNINTTSFLNGNWEGWTGESVLISRDLSRLEAIKICNYLNSKWNVYPVRECDIFVYGGQSNAVGSSNGINISSVMTNGGEYGFYCDPQYFYNVNETPISCMRGGQQATISFYTPTDTTAKTSVTAGAGTAVAFGCWAELAQSYFLKTGRYAIFCGCAVSGSSMFNPNQWVPSNANNNLWANVKNVLSPLKSKLFANGWKVRTSNFCWIQGESDRLQNKNEYLTRFNQGLELPVNEYGYDNAFYWIITSRQAEGFGGNARIAQLEYNPTNPKIRCAFDLGLFTDTRLNLYQDNFHPNGEGIRISGEEAGKQIGEIIAKDQTLTLKSVVSVEQPVTIYSIEDVRYWGAVGNGINDDTQAIQLAFNNNSRRVYIPSGTYLITGDNNPLTLQNKTNFTLELDGCLFSYTGTGANSNMLSFINNTNLVVKGNSFFRQTTNGANSAVRIQNSNATASNSIFRGFNIQGVNNFTGNPVNQWNNGILVLTGNNTQNANTITECNIRNCQTGISLQAEYYTISNCIITRCSWYGIRVASTGGNFGIDNCNLQANGTGIIVLGITGNSDHGTITNCRINHNVFFGIHARQILLSLNISNCDIWANIGDVGYTSGYTLGTASVEPFDINNKPAPVAPNTIVSFGIVIDGGRNCVIDGNTIAHNIVNLGYGGCQLSTITGNFLKTDGARTTNHILEYFNVYGTNTGNYNNAQNTICNNVFSGNFIPAPANNVLQKAIKFYTTLNAYNIVASEYSVKNNTRTTGFNQLNFIPSLPDNQTYIIDPNYDAVNVNLVNTYDGRVLRLSTAMFGTSWDLNVNYPSNPASYAPLSFQITDNYIGLDVPTINCKGISYNSGTKTYTITSAGRYTFTDIGGNNTWIITSNINPSDINIITSDIIVSKLNVKNINFINPASNRTLTFDGTGFTSNDVGFTFDVYFSDTTLIANNDIIVENQLGAPNTIIYINTRTTLKTTITNANGANLNANANDKYFGYRFIYINGTASDPNEIWRINQF